ncbi:MAG: hypothetical protein JSU68_04920 [Phycisphaerales bacterium]|nr:MAG: hypothetical protein JSU68_04920 [Phycisphaerales bacterium]
MLRLRNLGAVLAAFVAVIGFSNAAFGQGACCHGDGNCSIEASQQDCAVIWDGAWLGAGTLCDVGVCDEDLECEDCGPGAHWIDTCVAGSDNITSEALVGIDRTLDCVADQNLVMRGPVTVLRAIPLDDSVYFPGTRPIDGHLDVIDTEIVQMELTGWGGEVLKAGLFQGNGNVLVATLGNIAEKTTDNAIGESFFDVYFEIYVPDLGYLYNHAAMTLSSEIDCVPPEVGIYVHEIGCIDLYDDPVGGTLIAKLVSPNHNTFPQPAEACCLSDGTDCVEVAAETCAAYEGTTKGRGTSCLGDYDGDGVDEMCEVKSAVPALTGPGAAVLALLLVIAAVVVLRRWRTERA